MEKSQVIEIRNKLKAGKNLPVVVYIDNLPKIIDESNILQFTKWDDENAILYNYSLTDPVLEKSPSNIGAGITLFATGYENIQSMEVSRIPVNELANSIDSLGCISAEFKERIIKVFEYVLDPNLDSLSYSDINEIIGQRVLNNNDDYYEGKFTESFAETIGMAKHNEYANKVAKENAEKLAKENANNKTK